MTSSYAGIGKDNRTVEEMIFKVLMKRKIRYCDYGFIGKSFEKTS